MLVALPLHLPLQSRGCQLITHSPNINICEPGWLHFSELSPRALTSFFAFQIQECTREEGQKTITWKKISTVPEKFCNSKPNSSHSYMWHLCPLFSDKYSSPFKARKKGWNHLKKNSNCWLVSNKFSLLTEDPRWKLVCLHSRGSQTCLGSDSWSPSAHINIVCLYVLNNWPPELVQATSHRFCQINTYFTETKNWAKYS